MTPLAQLVVAATVGFVVGLAVGGLMMFLAIKDVIDKKGW